MAIRWDEVEGTNFGPYLYSIEDEAERLEVLFRECYDEVRKQCAKALALAGNFSDADDAAQETLLKAAASVRKTYKPEMPFRPWLRQIAQNVCRDFGRAQSRKDKTNERWVTSGYGVGVCTPAPEMESPEEALIRNLRNEAVVRSLLALPESERSALYWRVYEGLTYDEISELWGHSHSSVRTAIYRAKDKVKRHFVALGGMDDWGLPGVVGAAVAAVRRFRGRSRAWMTRNVGTVGMDGGSTGTIALSRAAEVVATAAVAVGLLLFPGGDDSSSAPSTAPATSAADSAIQSASFRVASEASLVGRADDVDGTSSPAQDNMRPISAEDPSVVALPAAPLPPGPERQGDGYERSEDGKYARSPFRVEQQVPVVGEVSAGNDEGAAFECDYSAVRQAACDTLDHLPDL